MLFLPLWAHSTGAAVPQRGVVSLVTVVRSNKMAGTFGATPDSLVVFVCALGVRLKVRSMDPPHSSWTVK